jgi:hypothetical protein
LQTLVGDVNWNRLTTYIISRRVENLQRISFTVITGDR